MHVQMQVQLQVQLQIRMKLTVLRLLLKRIFLLIQITVLIMRIMRIIPIYFQGGSISGGSTFKDGSVPPVLDFARQAHYPLKMKINITTQAMKPSGENPLLEFKK